MKRTRSIIAATAIGGALVISGGVAYAATSAGEPPAPVVSNDETHGTSVFECYNSGKPSYAEFRLPLPHTCWFPGDVLVQVPASTFTFTVKVPAGTIDSTQAALKLTETCTSTFDGSGDAQNPSYACTVTSP